MSSRWVEISCSLSLCRKVFAILKQKNPDLIPDHVDIIPYRKNSKNCHFHDASRALGIEDNDHDWIAHFDDRGGYGSHVCIKQNFLIFPLTIPSWEEDPDKRIYKTNNISGYHLQPLFNTAFWHNYKSIN